MGNQRVWVLGSIDEVELDNKANYIKIIYFFVNF